MIDKVDSSGGKRLISIVRENSSTRKPPEEVDSEIAFSSDEIQNIIDNVESSDQMFGQVIGVIVERLLLDFGVDDEAKAIVVDRVTAQLKMLGYDIDHLKKLK